MSGTEPVRFAGVVLAAGASRRMGRNKMLLTIEGVSLLRRAVSRAVDAGLDPVVVVVGQDEPSFRTELEGLGCKLVRNPDHAGPMSGSLHCGLQALTPDVEAAVVILPDMVHVSVDMLKALSDAARRSPSAPLVGSRYGDVTAPPILFRRGLFSDLLAVREEGCGKAVVMNYAREAVYLDWSTDALTDVDTPADFARVSSTGW